MVNASLSARNVHAEIHCESERERKRGKRGKKTSAGERAAGSHVRREDFYALAAAGRRFSSISSADPPSPRRATSGAMESMESLSATSKILPRSLAVRQWARDRRAQGACIRVRRRVSASDARTAAQICTRARARHLGESSVRRLLLIIGSG